MKKLITQTLMAAAIGGTVLCATPADAASFSISVGFPGVGFSYNSGGYCDSRGCPNEFWNYPIYYCPVYYGGRWYSGPAYYRYSGGRYQYWIQGGWRRDSWNRPRPSGACVDRYGPPLDLDFYIWNGFNVRDQWRYSWRTSATLGGITVRNGIVQIAVIRAGRVGYPHLSAITTGTASATGTVIANGPGRTGIVGTGNARTTSSVAPVRLPWLQ